jgi:hypothetical protein
MVVPTLDTVRLSYLIDLLTPLQVRQIYAYIVTPHYSP